MQAKIDQVETDDNPNEEAKVTREGGDRAYKKEGWEERQNSWGKGLDISQHRAEDRGRVDVEIKEWSVQRYL